MGFFKGALRVAVAIVFALVGIAVLGAIATYAYEAYQKSKARPYEAVRHWSFDASEHLGLKFTGKTKLSESRLYADFRFDGYPPYLKYAVNSSPNSKASITVQFKDKDGFKVYEKVIGLREFTTMLDKGASTGLAYEYNEYVGLDTYVRFDRAELTWNLDTSAPKPEAAEAQAAARPELADHCAPNISKAERLKRLSRHGTVRETGLNEYSAGIRSITFLSSTELLNCT